MSWMWSARLYNALIAALSRYSTAVRSTVSRAPPEAASVVAVMSAWLKLSMLLRSISPAAMTACGIEGERRGHHAILAVR